MAGKASAECEICFESFDDNLRIPKFLDCFHTYCVPCLKMILLHGIIKCPACEKETRILKGGQVETLQTNFYLTSSDTGKMIKKQDKARNRLNNHDSRGVSELKLDNLRAALAARREMGEKLEVTLACFQTFFQDLYEMRKMNRQKMKNVERYIEELNSDKGFSEQDRRLPNYKVEDVPGKQLERSFASIAVECEKAQASYSLLTSIARLNFTLSIDADSNNKELSEEFFRQPIELGIVPDQASGQNGQCRAALSYLVLLYTEAGKKWHTSFLTDGIVKGQKQSLKNPRGTVAESLKNSGTQVFDENRNISHQDFNSISNKIQQKLKPMDHLASQSAESGKTDVNKTSAPLLELATLSWILPLTKFKCFLGFRVNGQPYGRVVVELQPELAPNMSRRFAELCDSKTETYLGSTISKSEPGAYIMGGRTSGAEDLFMADPSPLKRGRGVILLRLKRDVSKTRCTIVASEFIIQLNDEKKDSRWSTTVFGYVCGGIDICDKISRIDCSKSSVLICNAGIIK